MSAASKLSDQALDQIVRSLADGLSQTAIARTHAVSQQAISKRLKDPVFRKRVDAAVRADSRRKRNADLRAARKLRHQQGIDWSIRPEPAGAVMRVDPTEKDRSQERVLRPGRLPDHPGPLIAATERGITHPGTVPARPRYPDSGRVPVRRAGAAWRARLDQAAYDREHGLYECRLRDSDGRELRYGCFDRETTRRLLAEPEPWEILRRISP